MGFQRLLNFVGRNAGDVAKAVLPGSALAGGFGLLESPKAGLTYGLMDAAFAFPATMAARGLTRNVKNPIIQNALEGVTNIGASIGSTVASSNLLYGNQLMPTNMSQAQQIQHEMMQRAAVNNLDVQAVSPNTQFQTAGLEFLQNYAQQMPQYTDYMSPYELQMLEQAGVIGRG